MTTPNSDVIYAMSYVDFGMVGPDRGQGGKYLLLPPDHEGESPEGHFVARSRTYRVWGMARAGQKISGVGGQAIQWYGNNCAVYPLKDGYKKPNITNVGRRARTER